jgi:hypothetical protein
MPTSLANVLRCERKFEVDAAWPAGVDRYQLEAWVRCHPAMFRPTFPPRQVNNLYLDTVGLAAYVANLNGDTERCKTRIRWYQDVFGLIARPQLEFKFKYGLVTRKSVYLLDALTLQPGFGARDIRALLARSELSVEVRAQLAGLTVTLFNRYRRSYWETPDGHFRLTIDTELVGCPIDRLRNYLLGGYVEGGVAVVELKYDTQYDGEADEIANALPFRLTRHSKYAEGIERGYGMENGGMRL